MLDTERHVPYSLRWNDQDLQYALGNITHSVGVAYGPLPIDGEDETEFVERWMGLVAKAAVGELDRPSSMPINSFG
jgi:eukaryotic-like serine/threonine-protein kinase